MSENNQNVLEQQIKIYSEEEIKNATNNYDVNLIALHIHEAYVYRATIDDREVVIKTPRKVDENRNPALVNHFLTDVSVAVVIQHDNMNKVYGCCLETYIPMIVYHRTSTRMVLDRYLHVDLGLRRLFTWTGRLKVATDVAYALCYMHNALSKPVIHRDIKSFCVLIDSSFHAILANGYKLTVFCVL
ncbi:hypothetical protein RND81_04G228900 [Saponaria officinalis]|uniref:Protein kinase domain-containing protein n=1 Tax=Saponaria officinalis TaxID=3572 RepID=A0AAW1LRH7_SAPOF